MVMLGFPNPNLKLQIRLFIVIGRNTSVYFLLIGPSRWSRTLDRTPLTACWLFSPLTPTPSSLTGGSAVTTHLACWFFAAFPSRPFSGFRDRLAAPISSPSILELVVKNVPALTMFCPPAEAVTKVWLRKGLGAISRSLVSDENLSSLHPADAVAWSQRCYFYLDTHTPRYHADTVLPLISPYRSNGLYTHRLSVDFAPLNRESSWWLKHGVKWHTLW